MDTARSIVHLCYALYQNTDLYLMPLLGLVCLDLRHAPHFTRQRSIR